MIWGKLQARCGWSAGRMLGLALWLVWPLAAMAASPLRMEFVPQLTRSRTAAPVPVTVRLSWDAARLLEGRLEMEFRDGNRILARYRSMDMALTTGEQQFRLLLPPLPTAAEAQVQVRLWFVGANERIGPQTQVMNVPWSAERALAVAVCSARETAVPRLHQLEQSLRLERFLPPSESPALQRPLTTSVARLMPDALPANPLAYCAYDIVVLDSGVLGGLGERQREALRRWVEAGGSLCVFAGEKLNAEQCDYLNSLAAGTRRFSLSPDGRLLDRDTVRLRPGLGRCVVVTQPFAMDTDPLTAAWRAEVGFMWKLRVNVAAALARDGKLDPVALAAEADGLTHYPSSLGHLQRERVYLQQQRRNYMTGYGAQPLAAGGELMQGLMPRNVRLIPLSALFGILLLFVLLIGPVDWWVLGWVKRRRYTWVLFPCVTAAVTAATIAMANHYMGQGDQHRALIVVDIGPKGAVLRQDRYELSFTGRDRRVTAAQQQALWSRVERSATADTGYYNPYNAGARYPGAARPSGSGGGDDEVSEFDGTLPLRYQVSYGMRQWEPRLSRSLSLEGTAPKAPFSWDRVDERLRAGQGKELIHELQENSRGVMDVTVFRGGRPVQPLGSRCLSEAVLTNICAPTPPRGLFVLAAQLSPTGGGNFEDLQLLDSSDPDQWLVVATVTSGEDIVVYRRLYHAQ